jgi:DNA (cytosine-5)-methyltransferase 1
MLTILNLFAGIGGNRAQWEGVNVTAVELDGAIAHQYQKRFQDDVVIIGDSVTFLQKHYKFFDFIWASPPCQTHGQYRHNVGVIAKGYEVLVPDMTNLYGVITFLDKYFGGGWCVENTIPYYEPLIKPSAKVGRHLFWSNFTINDLESVGASNIRSKNKISDYNASEFVSGSAIKNKRQVLRNCVDSSLGLHILECFKNKNERGNTNE